jgi:hypothetical protein
MCAVQPEGKVVVNPSPLTAGPESAASAGAASAPVARTAVSAAQRWSMLLALPSLAQVHAAIVS